MFTGERRQQVERIITKAFIEAALKQGWRLSAVDNSEDWTDSPNVEKAMEQAFLCDEAHIYFARPNDAAWVYIVLGNEGWTVICDYTVNLENVYKAIEPLIDKYDEEDSR